ncbi:class A beta-lactamase [Erythrobacter arachoides]|uniref:Beta-lactamase n=1 Tax=Aurantiacibacter arachoides TaxID=1850444 RepID=A0A845A1P2_9SPHN|nr:class A beta-lactamase [Aurantiacibacter arachoides]MXO94461.1 class A beta-lactamase [Aurantiacibacter arachoides]GGD63266.1 beta-lactamase [Aurantiacibacter arachoides]
MKIFGTGRIASLVALAIAPLALISTPAAAQVQGFESAFDSTFGTEVRAPRDYAPSYDSRIEQRIAQIAEGSRGRIGVAAIDLATGQEISVLGDQRFPMASTSKIAIAATFLEMVDQGRASLSSEYPMLYAVSSRPFSTSVAPVRRGEYMSAANLIEIMITRSSNQATDALLQAVGGPGAVNAWAQRAGLTDFSLDRDIATLVRDDGEFDPAHHIDLRDSATPQAMVQLLSGIYQGRWLSAESRRVILGAMERCRTGTRRIPAMLPSGVSVAHKTGSLNNTSSDIGILTAPDGRTIAVAIYVTGQGSRPNREARIASIARAIYDGYAEMAFAANDNGDDNNGG